MRRKPAILTGSTLLEVARRLQERPAWRLAHERHVGRWVKEWVPLFNRRWAEGRRAA